MVSKLSDYPWSSHNAYLGESCPDWLTRDQVLALFGAKENTARRRYAKFMNQTQPEQIIQLFRAGSNDDDRILGDDTWRKKILNCTAPNPKIDTLDELVQRVCERNNVTEADLITRSRQRKYAAIRAEIAIEATEFSIATVTAVAQCFGRSQPSLSRTMNRLRDERQ